jgi:sugar phosphate isomerase/epimerase
MSLSRRPFLAGAAALAALPALPAEARFGNYEFGSCSPTRDFDDAVKYGLDYHEPSVSEINGMSDATFEAFRRKVLASPIRCKRLNFFTSPPPGLNDLPVMRVVGDEANLDELGTYAEKGIARSKQLGAVIVVWGSSASRRVAEGYSRERAWEQIKAFLRMCDPIARAHEIMLAIEPIRPASSNILSTGAETLKMVRELNLPNVRMMIDYSQMRGAGEDPEIVWTAHEEIVHFHFRQSERRQRIGLAEGPLRRPLLRPVLCSGKENELPRRHLRGSPRHHRRRFGRHTGVFPQGVGIDNPKCLEQ